MAKKTSAQKGSGPYPLNICEEQLKNKVAHDYFSDYDTTNIIGKIDFCIAKVTEKTKGAQKSLFEEMNVIQSFFWAEAKMGTKKDIYESIVQLILTIGKSKVRGEQLPPLFLGAFDAQKIAFIPYIAISDVFSQNDFNWEVTPSNHSTKEFKQLYETVKNELENNARQFRFGDDDVALREFIKNSFKIGRAGVQGIKITKNNFTTVYYKWLQRVKPTIKIDWENAKQEGILDADFYLADLLSKDNESIKDSLNVLLKSNRYEVKQGVNAWGMKLKMDVSFYDNQKAHHEFWNIYDRPPRKEFWDYIVQRRDLLTPQDVRERKGSFFTPQQWVELSQLYLADVLGENWQDEYYVWDCAAGTGNLLAGLTNPKNIWASTLDQADVDVMYDRIKNGANLFKGHVFQFDFLNDDFNCKKVPDDLKSILSDPEKRKKLVIYINPPYAEATTATTVTKTGSNKAGVANTNETYKKYKNKIGKASNEIFAQFLIRIYCELQRCKIANFATLKALCAFNFAEFRNIYQAKLEKLFLVPAKTFDNVRGAFPIGFHIWDSDIKEQFTKINADVYNADGSFYCNKIIQVDDANSLSLNKWIKQFDDKQGDCLGLMDTAPSDYQNNKFVNIAHDMGARMVRNPYYFNQHNLIEGCVYLAIRHCIPADWLNDRDQFLYPNDGWKTDSEFQTDCLVFTIFHGQNRISCKDGVNHWIPFSEQEVGSNDVFASHFMNDFLSGKITTESLDGGLFASNQKPKKVKLKYSSEAKAVLKAGRELWRYYHEKSSEYKYDHNASLYDIKAFFQGRNDKGKMNNSSADEKYNKLIGNLRSALKDLAKQIEPKVYEYGFLRE
ncbi:MAG: hypothetical protein IKX40_04220 [Thermoguttaceae bacterium]|nr:hypothetical protein [Thermoguttaceae bacterium]